MSEQQIKVPDIGDFDEVAVIEVLVKVGDTVKAEQSLITVESDKASMEIPSSAAGVVKSLAVKVGDKHWVFPHSREQIARDEKKAAIRTAQITANVAAGKRN